MEHCTNHDQALAWDDVAKVYAKRIYRHAYRLTRNRADAEDLTQEVFVRVFRHLKNYEPGTFEGWLHRITVNLFLDQLRRGRGLRFEPLTDIHQRAGPADQDLEYRTFEADVRSALDSLAPGKLAVIALHDIDGLTYAEVAALLGIRCGTVASRLHRAHAQLRTALAHRAPRDLSDPVDNAIHHPSPWGRAQSDSPFKLQTGGCHVRTVSHVPDR
ncbi:sigma-70 family RNA polymerase sigma factor [Kribbella sp. NPDC049174]|uniref:sigma-70 family RNA polymerase sigma factor n=1 Tax=Kribbella sp. NPDC049174 TaxID=3364112 RepID=UPI003711E4C2